MNKLSDFRKQQFNGIFAEASNVGNQVLVDDRTILNAAVDYTISGLNGDIDLFYMFFCEVAGSSGGGALYVRPNLDSTSSYISDRQYGGHAHGGDSYYNNVGLGLVISEISPSHNFFSEGKLNAKSGHSRHLIMVEGGYNSGLTFHSSQTYSNVQRNTTSIITSLNIHSNSITINTGIIRLYKQNNTI